MDLDQYDKYILVPALKIAALYSKSAHVLMLGTVICESNLEYIEQIGPGMAMGFPQVESQTHADVRRYLNKYNNRNFKEAILSACFYTCFPSDDALIHNLRYSILIARLKYWMVPKILPEWNDALGLAKYYKKYYNTSEGKADIDRAKKIFEKIINERFKDS